MLNPNIPSEGIWNFVSSIPFLPQRSQVCPFIKLFINPTHIHLNIKNALLQ